MTGTIAGEKSWQKPGCNYLAVDYRVLGLSLTPWTAFDTDRHWRQYFEDSLDWGLVCRSLIDWERTLDLMAADCTMMGLAVESRHAVVEDKDVESSVAEGDIEPAAAVEQGHCSVSDSDSTHLQSAEGSHLFAAGPVGEVFAPRQMKFERPLTIARSLSEISPEAFEAIG